MYGILPKETWHLLWLLIPILVWWVTRQLAKRQNLSILHNSILAVSYWEELLFRGIIFGLVLSVWSSLWPALIVSSLVFGVFHLRNLWWSSRKQVLINCLYAGLVFGPIVGLVRWWQGDIYLGIAIHAIHNFAFFGTPAKAQQPTDKFLVSKQHNMNWFERFFSGFWLMKVNKP
jgi:membrane protease YdiL (CAAX protease family)